MKTAGSLLWCGLVIAMCFALACGNPPSAPSTPSAGTAATLVVTGLPSSVSAGVAASFTVTAKDAFGQTATGYRGTAHFTTTDTAATLPPDYSFISADAGSHAFPVTLKTLGSQAVTVTDVATRSITGSQAVTVTPGTPAMLVVSGLPCNAVVTARDALGNATTGYSGTVHFTATDPAAGLPPDYTFVGADAGTHTFPVSLKTPGSQRVTVTDFTNSLTGSQAVTVPALSDRPLYVANADRITVYAAGASCNATPPTIIAGSNTGLSVPWGIALDAAGRLYVVNYGNNSITVYAAGASGNATPTTTIAGSNTGLDLPLGIAVNAAGQFYVANNTNTLDATPGLIESITIYAAGATGNVSPKATIAGSSTGLNWPVGIALDGSGRLYVTNSANGTITVYAAGASGNATPTATIAGANTGGIALDAVGRLYVASSNNTITVYAAGASGNATPTATIAGSNTGLSDPQGIALDAAGRLYVVNYGNNSITVYAAGATGNATPIATIAGSNTLLNRPTFITF